MKYLYLCILLIFLISESSFGQSKQIVLSGHVYSSDDNSALAGVLVNAGTSKNSSIQNTITDEDGRFQLTLPPAIYHLTYSVLGYKKKIEVLNCTRNQNHSVTLNSDAVSLQEIEVNAIRRDNNIKSVELGSDRLDVKEINKIPVLFGEKDILKAIQLLPGVQSSGDGNTGYYVRGGNSDQNLILMDRATVYNPSHLFGFFSTFNSDAVEDMTLYKGTMPAEYGGRLSSVLNVRMRDGDKQHLTFSGGIGLISSRLTLEGPIQKNRSSFLVSVRRTYADALAHLMGIKAIKGSSLYFYDFNAKLTYFLSKNDKLSLTAFNGRDQFGMQSITNFGWMNTIGSLKWDHMFGSKSLLKSTLTYTGYRYDVDVNIDQEFTVESHINDFNWHEEYDMFFKNNTLKIGFNSIEHRIVPGELTSADSSRMEFKPFFHRNSWDNAVYIQNSTKISSRIKVGYGVRFSAFSILGGSDLYNYDQNHNVVDTIHTKSGKIAKTYFSIEPRLSLNYSLTHSSSIKMGYTRTTQNLHLMAISNMEATPSDRWIPSSNYVKPEISDQFSIGYFKNFDNNIFEFSVEAYYKKLQNQIDYKDGTSNIFRIDNIEPFLLFGKGRAYGLEFFLKKKTGRFTGWVGYTLSRSEKKIDHINNGNWYLSNQDRTQNLSVVAMYDLTKKWSLSGTWVYTTGAPMTFPSGKYVVDGYIVSYYEGRNLYRAPAYHRLDLGATCTLKETKRHSSKLIFSLYNAYGRKNPFMYGFRKNAQDPTKTEIYKVSLFSFVPSISWDFKF